MKQILILTGACGVGKSTISKKWAQLKNGAVVECDFFTEWIYNKNWQRFTKKEATFVANLATKTAIEYLNAGMDVAIENVWKPDDLDILTNAFSKIEDVQVKPDLCISNRYET